MREIHAVVAPMGSRLRRRCHDLFNIHSTILAEPAQNKKPTVGFLARFYLRPKIFQKILTDNNL